ncbi:MAG: hypothetical protein AAFN12_00460 [Cyanobacteria bacterium J06560_2]
MPKLSGAFELSTEDEQIAQINKDRGVKSLEIELLTDFVEEGFLPKFLLADFMVALEEAYSLISEN